MDAHYNQVMKKIEAVAETKPRLYFAYSGILDRVEFEKWREEHSYEFFDLPEGLVVEALDTELIFDFPSRWWGGRVAGLAEKSGASVFGRLFEIKAKDWPVVQHKEGVITGMSIERPIRVRANGEVVEATAFTTSPQRASTQGEISRRFLEALVRGAKMSGLPEEYISKLQKLF